MQGVILAGGNEGRLLLYTTLLPKPYMPIGDYPLLDKILRQLQYFGFDEIIDSTGYLHEFIHADLAILKDPDLTIHIPMSISLLTLLMTVYTC